MLTKREIINQAFEEIGLGTYAYNMQAEDYQSALKRLNALLAEWGATGAITDGDETGGLDADSDVPLEAERGVICALACDVAPSFGKQPMPQTVSNARQGRVLMIRINTVIPTKEVNFASVPAGAGYKSPQRPFLYPDTPHYLNHHFTFFFFFFFFLEFDLDDRKLVLEDLWINILPEGGMHASHIHPHSVISGTTYVSMPEGTSALKLEDPRSAMMMASPVRVKDARRELKPFIYMKPAVGDVLLWESWLRHEVPMNMAEDERISVSFNYRWE